MDLKLFALIVHLIGFALGLGGATMSDVTFFKIIRSEKFSSQDLGTLLSLSKLIWIGFGLLILSGATMFWLIYAAQGSLPMLLSSRWQAKLTFVAILFLNGLIFKFYVLPILHESMFQTATMQFLKSKSWILAITGAISIVSWYSILIVSAMTREFKPPLVYFFATYLALIIGGAIVGRYMLKKSIK